MTFSLVNSALIGLVALGVIPLLIHLFARGRPPIVKFSSVDFLQKIARSTARIRRPKDWLLLALRTLAVLALVAALLRPLLFSEGRLPEGGEKTVVLVIDRTASMAATDGARSRFASACAEAAKVVDSLRTGDRVNVVWLDANPNAEFPEPGVAFGALKEQVSRMGVSEEAANIPAAMALAGEMLERSESNGEVWIISDFQGPAWEANAPSAPTGTKLVNVRIGADRPANRAVISVSADNPRPLVGEEISVFCEVANYADEPRTAKVFLEAGEIRRSEELPLPAGEVGTAIFRCKFSEGGIITLRASVEDGGFAADDYRYGAVQVNESLKVGLFGGQRETSELFAEVLDALRWPSVDRLSVADLASAADYDVLILCGWDGVGAESVERACAAGATVIAMPGDDTSPEAFGLVGMDGNGIARRVESEPVAFSLSAADDPVFKLFSSGEFGEPGDGAASVRFDLPESIGSTGWTVLMSYADGVPALARRRVESGGSFFLWNISFEGENASRWAHRPQFVSLLGEILLVSRGMAPGAKFFSATEPGSSLGWQVGREILKTEAGLIDPNGEEIPIDAVVSGGKTDIFSLEPLPPGLYRWQSGEETLGIGAINFPPSESDLTSADPGALASSGNSIVLGSGSDPESLRAGVPLWPSLIIAAIVFLIAEGLVSLWAKPTS